MWKQILKMWGIAKSFHRKEINNGKQTSFWNERWSDLGILSEIFGDKGYIDLGIRRDAKVSEVLDTHKRRRHIVELLNKVEVEIVKYKATMKHIVDDIDLWKREVVIGKQFLRRKP